jgi:hypothetical protein
MTKTRANGAFHDVIKKSRINSAHIAILLGSSAMKTPHYVIFSILLWLLCSAV